MQGSFIAGGGHFWKTGSGFLLGLYSGRSSHSRGLGDMQCFHTCSLGHSMGQHWEGPMAGWGRQLQGMGLGLCIPAKCLFLVWKSDYLPQSTSSFPTSCVEFDKHLFSFFLPSLSWTVCFHVNPHQFELKNMKSTKNYISFSFICLILLLMVLMFWKWIFKYIYIWIYTEPLLLDSVRLVI